MAVMPRRVTRPIVAQQVGKLIPAVPTPVRQVESFEIAILRLMKIDQNRHDFTEDQATSPFKVLHSMLYNITILADLVSLNV